MIIQTSELKIPADVQRREIERESEMSHFARPQKSRRVQEKARFGQYQYLSIFLKFFKSPSLWLLVPHGLDTAAGSLSQLACAGGGFGDDAGFGADAGFGGFGTVDSGGDTACARMGISTNVSLEFRKIFSCFRSLMRRKKKLCSKARLPSR